MISLFFTTLKLLIFLIVTVFIALVKTRLNFSCIIVFAPVLLFPLAVAVCNNPPEK